MRARFAFLAASIALGLMLAALPQAASQAGTVGYWRFEESSGNALDSGPNGITLTPFGSPSRSTINLPPVPFANTQSAQFDGQNGVFASNGGIIQNNAGDDPFDPGAGNFTLEAWIRPLSGSGYLFGKSFNSGGASEDKGFQIVYEDQGNGRYRLRGGVRTTAGGFFDTDVQSGPAGVAYDEWHHVAMVRSGGDLTFYLDGAQNGDQRLGILAGKDFRSRVPYTIGAGIVGGSPGSMATFGSGGSGAMAHPLTGFIDEVRISDVALSPNEFLIPEPASLGIVLGVLALAGLRSRAP